ncbi:MAG: response regulator [Actinobacteria bacterium]|nr:response regulator [Actinomycetota bacterium]
MPRILMVDGDPDVVHAGRTILENHGMMVDEARGVGETLARCGEWSPDLVYIDVMHRQPAEGVSIAEQIRAGGSDGVIMILATVDRSKGFFTYESDGSLAPVDIPEKPMEPAALVRAIEHVLGE